MGTSMDANAGSVSQSGSVGSNLPQLDATALRTLGEHADGFRDTDLFLTVTQTDGDYEFDIKKPADLGDGDTPVLRVRTASNIGRRPPATLTISVGGKSVPAAELAKISVDAAFTSESSIEKFLFPYYEGIRIFDRDYLTRLKDAYFAPDSRIVAFLHESPSISHPVVASIGANRRRAVHVVLDDPAQADTLVLKPLHEFLPEG